MGSYNVTCAISRLTISSGEEVMLLPIIQNPYSIERLEGLYGPLKKDYSKPNSAKLIKQLEQLPWVTNTLRNTQPNTYWAIAALPLMGRYDSYGSINLEKATTPLHKANQKQFLQTLKALLQPLDQGTNSVHDLPVNLKSLTLEALLERLQKGRTFHHYNAPLKPVKGTQERFLAIKYLFIKASVWNSLCTLPIPSVNETPVYSVSGLADAITKVLGHPKKMADISGYLSMLARLQAFNDSPFTHPFEIGHTLQLKDKRILTPLAAELEYVYAWITTLRITLHPTTGSGCQDNNHAAWNQVNNIFRKLSQPTNEY